MGAETLYTEKRNRLGLLTLNRPGSLNALDEEMIMALSAALQNWQDDPQIYGVILQARGEHAFCAGADVKQISALGQKDLSAARAFFEKEYRYNWQLHNFTKPHIALMNGLVLGGGVGISLYGTHRVAAKNYAFGMPETAIGLIPDVGASWFLGHLPNSMGLYLALTGRSITRSDAYGLGLVTHCIDAEHFSPIKQAISEGEPVDVLLDGLHEDPGKGELHSRHGWIEAIFSASTLEEIMHRAKALADESEGWSQKVHDELAQKSPTSLHLAHALWKKGRQSSLRRALGREYNVVATLLAGPDFHEGVRAMLIDKDKSPAWQPSQLSDVSKAELETFFENEGRQLQLREQVGV
ncbi:MAG: enoyl-CoA hydratase/isomerase family protein [Hyphomicrobiaceae bacterium]|nr:enoyl-CoA hydratase/isomerase family protein [Hyphomicrobiaceae bacterium]